MYCSYCNKEIINKKRPNGDTDYSKAYKSSEHIIQNAIGGKLESEKICCDRCNFHIEQLIDKKFCDIFSPIISDIKNFKKTNNCNNSSKYEGYAMLTKGDKNIIIRGDVIKNSKVKYSRQLIEIEKEAGTEDLNNRLKNSINKARVLFADFKLDNTAFKQGLSKIAYNYAIYLGINLKNIPNVCEVTLDKKNKEISKIKFNTKVIPFYPGNELDNFIELNTNISLFHNLILYRYKTELWCYIGLFNTFQCYILLSEDFPNEENTLYKNYGQEFQYVQSNMNSNHMYNDVIMDKINKYVESNSDCIKDFSYDFYVSQNKLNECFRILNPLEKFSDGKYKDISYPLWIVQTKAQEKISKYTTKKFIQLNKYLIKENPTIVDEDFFNMSKENQNKFLNLLLKSINPNK